MKVEKLLVLSLLLATSMGATAQEVLLNSAGKVGEFEFPSQNEASAKAKAPAADDKEYMIKYSGNSVYALGGMSSSVTMRLSLRVKPEDAQALQGMKLTTIGYYLSAYNSYSTPGMSDFHLFVSDVPEGGSDIVAQECTGDDIAAGGHEIVLDTPYTITGEPFYIGYETTMAANAYGIGFCPDTNDEWQNYYFSQYYNGEWSENLWSSDYGTLQVYGLVEGDAGIEQVELSLQSVSAPAYAKSGESFPVTVVISNDGLEVLDEVSLSYTVGGEEQQAVVQGPFYPTSPVSASLDCTLETQLDIETVDMTFEVASMDGRDDADPSDNTATAEVSVYNEGVGFDTPRGILLEQFTTEMCPNCPSGHSVLESALSRYDADVIRVAHHAGYYYDSYTLDYSEMICSFFFNANYTFAPAAMFGRKHYTEIADPYDESSPSPGPIFGISVSNVNIAMNDQLSIPNFVSINVETSMDEANNKLNIRVYGQSLVNSDNPTVNVFITEDGIRSNNQSGASGVWTHNDVLREVLTGDWGAEVQFAEDGSYEYTTEWDVKTSIRGSYGTTSVNLDNISVVAFISNTDRSNPSNCEVYNCAKVENVISSGVDRTAADDVHVYADGSSIVIDGSFDEARVWTVDGVTVRSMGEGDGMTTVQGLAPGIYVVKVTSGTGSQVTKVMVD